MVYVVTRGDEENGWIALSEIKKEKLSALTPSIPTAKRTGYAGPTCSTVSPAGEYLVVSQMGKEGEAKDSRLVFYTLQGKLLRNFEVELHDIVSLAYSPNRKHLFAIDYNYADPTKGALYKLIGSGADKCDVKKLQDLAYTTSMVFDSKGTLWITTLGGPPVSDGKPNGKLIKIEGLDDTPVESDSEEEESES
jgi:sugar lactone lactonase YvrE